MNIPRLRFSVLSLIFIAGCAHSPKSVETAPKVPESAPKAAETAPIVPESAMEAIKLPHMCLGRAMHASMALPIDASPEQKKKVYWDGYFEAFLDAKEQKKYVNCLDEDRADKDYEKKSPRSGEVAQVLSRRGGEV